MNTELQSVARHALNGACNPIALIRELSDAIKDMDQNEVRESSAVKVVVGQISFLLGESIGPSATAMDQFEKEYKAAQTPCDRCLEPTEQENLQICRGQILCDDCRHLWEKESDEPRDYNDADGIQTMRDLA